MQVSGCSFIAEDRKPLPKSLNPEESVRKVTFAKRNRNVSEVLGMQSYRCNRKFELQLVQTSLNKLCWELFSRVVSSEPQAFAYFKRTVLDIEF